MKYEKADVRFNSRVGAVLCNNCSTILSYGFDHVDVARYCENCYEKKHPYGSLNIEDIDYWEKDAILVSGEDRYYFQFYGDEPTLVEAIEYINDHTNAKVD